MGGTIARIARYLIALTFFTLSAIALPVFGGGASAAEKSLSWWHDGCGYSVSFEPGRIDETQLQNTVRLLYGPPDFAAPSVGLPFNPPSVAKLNLDHTTRECKAALDVAGRLEFLPLPGIEDYRRALMAEIEDTCQFETAEIRSFREPSALRDYAPAAACSPFVDALEGKTDLMAAFQQTLDERCRGDAAPAQCVERGHAKAETADGMHWVRLYVIKFGWSSCASEFTSRTVDSNKLELMRIALEQQFRHAFKAKNRCEATADSSGERSAVVALAEAAPAKPAATAEKPRAPGCSLKQRGRRAEPEQASCAAGNLLRRSAAATSGLPTSFSAGWAMHDRSFTWH
jgi:hypothetical protein